MRRARTQRRLAAAALVMTLVSLLAFSGDAPGAARPNGSPGALEPLVSAAVRGAGWSGAHRRRSGLGMNVAPFTDWSPEWALIDIFPRSAPWLDANGEPAGPELILAQDAAGWPLRTRGALGTRLGYAGGTPPGEYVISWEGDGALIGVAGAGTRLRCEDGGTLARCPSRRGRFDVEFSRERAVLLLTLGRMTPERRVHSIRVLMPGGVCGGAASALDQRAFCATARGGSGACRAPARCFDFAEVAFDRFRDAASALGTRITFHPLFLRDLSPYRALRFMDWQRTNGSPVQRWSERAKLSSPRYSVERGAPIELAIALANAAGADAWFSVPHLADDDFVRELGRLVRAELRPDLAAYVEYSNETWNADFSQSAHVIARGREQRSCGPDLGSADDWDQGRCFHALETLRVVRLFEQAFGAERGRVRGVLAGWSADDRASRLMLERVSRADPRADIDVLAIAPYFGAHLGEQRYQRQVARFDEDALFEELERGKYLDTPFRECGGALAAARSAMQRHARVAQDHGLPLVAYEGGQHLAARGAAKLDTRITELFERANRHPRMRDLYLDYLLAWRALGGTLFMHYYTVGLYDRHGAWGAKPSTDTPVAHAPKASALLEFAATAPCWWPGC